MVLAIDPGTERSGVVALSSTGVVFTAGVKSNPEIIELIRSGVDAGCILAIEKIEAMGMAVGASTFETVFWTGRFAEAWMSRGGTVCRLPRREIKLHLCGNMRAKDPHIRQALIDLYGGPSCTRGLGCLSGVKTHAWAALAVGVTYLDAHAGTFVAV